MRRRLVPDFDPDVVTAGCLETLDFAGHFLVLETSLEDQMFNFKAPETEAFQEAVEQARLINGAREELQARSQEPMLAFSDVAGLEAAIDQEIAVQRSAMPGGTGRVRAVA